MEDSYIGYDSKNRPTSFVGLDAVEAFRAATLRSANRAVAKGYHSDKRADYEESPHNGLTLYRTDL